MNTPPTVTVEDLVVLLGDSINGVDLASASDDDGDPIVKWRFLDTFGGADSGVFKLGGSAKAANVWFEVANGDLGTLEYHAGSVIGNEEVRVQVFDGSDWSSVGEFFIFSATPNVTKPIVNASDFHVVANEKVLVANFISAFDPDGWPIDRWKFKDRNTNISGGYFEFKGVQKASNTWFTIKAEDLDKLYYVGALIGQSEKIDIRARDGALWSIRNTVDGITAHNANRPIVIPSSHVLPTNTLVAIETLFEWTDEDGNTAKKYRFLDTSPGANSGFVSRNGIKQPAKTWIEVDADQLNTVGYTSASTMRNDKFRVRVFDGRHWSSIQTIQVMAEVLPEIESPSMTFIEDLLETVSLTDVFAQVDSGPQFTKYQIIDTTSTDPNPVFDLSAHLRDGLQALKSHTVHELSPDAFDEQIEIKGGKWEVRSYDEFFVRGFNGKFWSPWERGIVRTEPEMLDALSYPGITEDQPLSLLDFFSGFEPIVIPFSFFNAYPSDGRETDAASAQNFVPIDPDGRLAIRHQIAKFNELQSAVYFEEVPASYIDPEYETLGGYMSIGGYFDPDDDACAFAFTPASPFVPEVGDVWMNYGLCGIGLSWEEESFSRMVFSHEFGHVSGLKHPFAGDPIFSPEGAQHDYSVMYTFGDRGDGLYPRGFGLADIAWLQNIYGKNPNQNAGDTVYDIPGTWRKIDDDDNIDDNFVDVISDAGGIDTIDVSASPYDDRINLSEGGASFVGNPAEIGVENLWIAFGTVIENIITGVGNNQVRGNQSDNEISTGLGNDEIWSLGGNDLMMGGWNSDTYHWGIGDNHDTIDEQRRGGRDRIAVGDFEWAGLDDFTEDLSFRKLGRDMVIKFDIDGGPTEGSLTIKDQKWGGSRVETLSIFGFDVDLVDAFNKIATIDQKFTINFIDPPTQFGHLVIPV